MRSADMFDLQDHTQGVPKANHGMKKKIILYASAFELNPRSPFLLIHL